MQCTHFHLPQNFLLILVNDVTAAIFNNSLQKAIFSLVTSVINLHFTFLFFKSNIPLLNTSMPIATEGQVPGLHKLADCL